MIWITLSLQAIWFILLYRWTRSAGKKIEAMQDQIASNTIADVEQDKQLLDLWRTMADIENLVSDRDSRARTSAVKPRRKKS